MNDFMGTNFIWFMGVVENRNDPLKTGRVQCRAFAWDTASKSLLPTEQLVWSHPILPINNPTIQPPPEGTMVFGFYMDGLDRQVPMIIGQVPGIPDTTTDPSQGFSDPRTNDQLQSAPRSPQSVTYDTSGSGATIQESPNANRNPQFLNEPTSSRLTRNENIQNTIVQQKINSTVSGIPTATGGLEVAGIDVDSFLSTQIIVPTITIPPFSIGIHKSIGFEICGIGIGLDLALGFNFAIGIEIPIGLPVITIGGSIGLAIDLFGCLIGGIRIGNQIKIDGGVLLPLLPANKFISFRTINVTGTTYGGVSLGTMAGIPVSTTPMWDEPVTPYNAQYPYNSAYQSESGHVFEMDDTPGAERIQTFHRSGTFQEMHPDGSMVSKVTKNNYGITMADQNLNVMGSQHTTVNTDQSNMVQGDHTENIQGTSKILVNSDKIETILGNETKVTAKNLTQTITQNRYIDVKGTDNILIEGDRNITILGDCNIIVQGALNLQSLGDASLIVGGNYKVKVTGTYSIEAPIVTSTSDIIANHVSVDTHIHSGVQTGIETSGPPIPSA